MLLNTILPLNDGRITQLLCFSSDWFKVLSAFCLLALRRCFEHFIFQYWTTEINRLPTHAGAYVFANYFRHSACIFSFSPVFSITLMALSFCNLSAHCLFLCSLKLERGRMCRLTSGLLHGQSSPMSSVFKMRFQPVDHFFSGAAAINIHRVLLWASFSFDPLMKANLKESSKRLRTDRRLAAVLLEKPCTSWSLALESLDCCRNFFGLQECFWCCRSVFFLAFAFCDSLRLNAVPLLATGFIAKSCRPFLMNFLPHLAFFDLCWSWNMLWSFVFENQSLFSS